MKTEMLEMILELEHDEQVDVTTTDTKIFLTFSRSFKAEGHWKNLIKRIEDATGMKPTGINTVFYFVTLIYKNEE